MSRATADVEDRTSERELYYRIGSHSMDIDREILARIRSAIALDHQSKATDFQVRAGQTGSVLINLRTGKAQLIYDDLSPLHDGEDLGLRDTATDNEADGADV